MFELDGKTYELKFNLDRLKVVESYTKKPAVADMISTNGALSINSIECYFGFCLKETNSDTFVPRKTAIEIADKLIEQEGYMKVNNMIFERMQQDVPFLFQGA